MRERMRARRRRRALALAGATIGIALAGCARKGPPSGGPPDITPPFVVSTSPESGAAHVPLNAALSITFSEGMEPRTSGGAVALAPRIDIRQRRWSGRTLTVTLGQPLKPAQTYAFFVGASAHDRHGNAMAAPKAIVFSTADAFPPGVIEGTLEARGFDAAGTYLWVYADPRLPDSTARDFDALGVADAQGRFRIVGLGLPGRYRVWAFADLNTNLSYEPDKDVLAGADTVLSLTREHPVARDIRLRAVNPRAKAVVRGAVVDSTGDTLGVVRVVAISTSDSTRRVMVDAGARGAFELQLDAGTWRVRAWRDDDRNRIWRTDVEPASAVREFTLTPADQVTDVTLRLRRVLQGP
ncbi:MAG TPA: Ig-like domain-containing protein [Candidatus Eisenbacteria bacterium]|nr:Ig-like domain-containing protein [Candidatus Eisenbacteria bacterium]